MNIGYHHWRIIILINPMIKKLHWPIWTIKLGSGPHLAFVELHMWHVSKTSGDKSKSQVFRACLVWLQIQIDRSSTFAWSWNSFVTLELVCYPNGLNWPPCYPSVTDTALLYIYSFGQCCCQKRNSIKDPFLLVLLWRKSLKEFKTRRSSHHIKRYTLCNIPPIWLFKNLSLFLTILNFFTFLIPPLSLLTL